MKLIRRNKITLSVIGVLILIKVIWVTWAASGSGPLKENAMT